MCLHSCRLVVSALGRLLLLLMYRTVCRLCRTLGGARSTATLQFQLSSSLLLLLVLLHQALTSSVAHLLPLLKQQLALALLASLHRLDEQHVRHHLVGLLLVLPHLVGIP